MAAGAADDCMDEDGATDDGRADGKTIDDMLVGCAELEAFPSSNMVNLGLKGLLVAFGFLLNEVVGAGGVVASLVAEGEAKEEMLSWPSTPSSKAPSCLLMR